MRISDWSSDVCSSDLESLPALREAADDAAIVRVFVDAVAIAAEQRDDLIEEFSAARPDPRDILEKDDRNRAVFVGLEREPDSAQGEPVERLVFVGRRMDRCEKTREALAGRRKKQQIGRASGRERVCQYV